MSATDRPHAVTDGVEVLSRLNVTVDETTIESSGWRTIDLGGTGPVVRGTRHVMARFGVTLAFARNDNRSDDIRSLESAEVLPFPLLAANDAFGEAMDGPLPDLPPRLRRVYRPAISESATIGPFADAGVDGEAGRPPLRVMPLAADAPIDWQEPRGGARGRRAPGGIDRTSVPLLVGLMVFAWAVLLAIGIHKGMTPGSGAPIKWSN